MKARLLWIKISILFGHKKNTCFNTNLLYKKSKKKTYNNLISVPVGTERISLGLGYDQSGGEDSR